MHFPKRFHIIGAVLFVLGFYASGANIAQAAAYCTNSFPADGHNGPWYSNGAVHGNSVSVDCPTGSTHWHILYEIQWSSNGSVWNDWWGIERSGDGSPNDFSYGVPAACDGGLHIWRTHIHNYVSGGNMNKPSGGSGTYLGC